MSPAIHEFIKLDLTAMLTGTFAAIACGLLGNFLLLRRMSLMGDAISHSVLPGLVAGFLIAGTRDTAPTGPLFLGAAIAGIITVVLVELVRKLGRVEAGAAMGVVFTVMFALGVILLEQAAARGVDLDPDCVLNGQLVDVFWFPPESWSELLSLSTLGDLPRQFWTTLGMAITAAAFVAFFFKELRITAFDPAMATSLGINAGAMHYLLMLLVAASVVASFEAVGSILVIAMLVCPAATARMLTDRLATQVWLSLAVATLVGIGGYLLAAYGPRLVGSAGALNAAGMMTVLAGGLLLLAIVAAPRHGVIARGRRPRGLVEPESGTHKP